MLQRFMEDAQAMARAVRWGDTAYIEDKVETRPEDPPQPDRAEASLALLGPMVGVWCRLATRSGHGTQPTVLPKAAAPA